ncbi:unnamed protein product, partial [Hermetia illucens]
MDPNFQLVKLVDPKFAKLTLSSRKKKEPDPELAKQEREKASTSKSQTSRKLFDDVLTDDGSESEAEELNRIFCSKTTAKTSDNGAKDAQRKSERRSKSLSQRLHLSDSDETNCSFEIVARPEAVMSEMEKLEMSPTQPPARQSSQKLFTDSSPTDEKDVPLQQISSRLSSLSIKCPANPIENSSDERKARDAALEDIFKQQIEEKMKTVDEAPEMRRYSILTISSTAESPVKGQQEKDDDEDSDVVIISESEEEDDDDFYPVSVTQGPSTTISETMQQRINDFFENIPSLGSNQGPEQLFEHLEEKIDLTKSIEGSVKNDDSLPEDSIEICESSPESARRVPLTERPLEDSPSKMLLRSAQKASHRNSPFASPQRFASPSPRKPRTPRKVETPELPQSRLTPKKTTTPRKVTPSTLTRGGKCAQPDKKTPTTSGKVQTPKKAATSPRKPRTPRKTPTPKVPKKPENSRKSPSPQPQSARKPQQVPTEEVTESVTPSAPGSHRPSDRVSDASTEYQIERINISTTIKIKLQFNDEMLASIHSSPVTSTTSNLPRLTESESPTSPGPSGRHAEEQVHTPDNLKQRSLRDPGMLTFVDISKGSPISNFYANKELESHEDINPEEVIERGNPLPSPPIRDIPNSPENSPQHPEPTSSEEIFKARNPPQPETKNTRSIPQNSPPQRETKNIPSSPQISPPQPEIRNTRSSPEISPPQPETQSTHCSPQSPPPAKESSPEVEIDDTAQKLLDQLYGDEWKTPDVVKTLKKKSALNISQRVDAIDRTVVNESMMDFSKFHKDIRTDLESTRLPDVSQSTRKAIFKVPATERKITRTKKDVDKAIASERKPVRSIKGQTPRVQVRPKCDSDLSDSDSDFGASSDESWKNVFSYSSDSSSESNKGTISMRKPSKKTKKKNSSKDEIIYLDLSSDLIKVQEVNESPCANKDEGFQRRLQEILDTCKLPDKKKLEATPRNPKTKRKLFTPRFGEEDEAGPVLSTRKEDKTTDNDVVILNAPLPAMFEPINKHLEAVKTGKPIFPLRTPKTISKKNKENVPSGSDVSTPQNTPRTQKGSKTKQDDDFNSGLPSTPCDKYGFLQSLDVIVAKKFCHPEALMYRENYKTKKQELAEKLYEMYNAKVFNNDLNVALVWNKKLLNTAGRCSCST